MTPKAGCARPYASLNGVILAFLCLGFSAHAQYTDVINSNRPGKSVSAYAVGTGVIQLETGLLYEQREHSVLDTESGVFGADIALRYGLLFESLELHWEGTYVSESLTFNPGGEKETLTDFTTNRLGLKFLLYDPYKDPERNKPNLYSWRANNAFQLKNLVPAVSIYAGATFTLGDNPFYPGDPTVSPRVMAATQSRLTPRFVLITNVAYDRVGTDFPEWSYLVSLSHAFRNPKWSVFVENQGIQSDRYSDVLLRSGIAHLFHENFQADLLVGAGFKNTPSRIFVAAGISYRLDYHQDKVKPIDEQESRIGRKAQKKKKKKSGDSGKGILPDPS
jgi:hypothetical protein